MTRSASVQLLNIKLIDPQKRNLLVRKSRSLRGSSEFGKIFINSDLTPSQQQKHKILRRELKERNRRECCNLCGECQNEILDYKFSKAILTDPQQPLHVIFSANVTELLLSLTKSELHFIKNVHVFATTES